MTGSALDEILPERIVMGLGTGPAAAPEADGHPLLRRTRRWPRSRRRSTSCATLWAGERIASATPGLPPIQPMFPPVHRIPLYVAAYRKEFVELAGRKADGYLARPCESIPSLRGILERLRASARGRRPRPGRGGHRGLPAVARGPDPPRGPEPGQARALRHLHDVGPGRRFAGPGRLRADLRDRIAAAWRAEEYHEAGQADPRRAARRVHALRHPRGRGRARRCLPRRHGPGPAAAAAGSPGGVADARGHRGRPAVRASCPTAAAGRRGRSGSRAPSPRREAAPRRPTAASACSERAAAPRGGRLRDPAAVRLHRLRDPDRRRRRAGRTSTRRFEWLPFLAALAAGMLLHSGANVTNEVFDVRAGHRQDHLAAGEPRHPQGSHQRARRARSSPWRSSPRPPSSACTWSALRGPGHARPSGLVGLVVGYTLHRPAAAAQVPRPGAAARLAADGPAHGRGLVLRRHRPVRSAHPGAWRCPLGLLVGAIIHGNEWRDIGDDTAGRDRHAVRPAAGASSPTTRTWRSSSART